MPFKYRSITANCGNDTIGQKASNKISEIVKEENTDFVVINCQEAHFGKTLEDLKKSLEGTGYEVKCLSQMVTRTKPDMILPTTGMATFVVYKTGMEIKVDGDPEEVRRSSTLPFGSAYNKGGLVTNFTVKNGDESIKVQAVTGHLDASNVVKRNQDWRNLYAATFKDLEVVKKEKKRTTDWDALVELCPDVMLSGYDANTRNKFDKKNNIETKVWENPEDHPELHAIDLVSKGVFKHSKETTYDHTQYEDGIADPKREGDAARGSLDILITYDGTINQMESESLKKINMEDAIDVSPEAGSARDHYVVISPPNDSNSLVPFLRVRNFMAAQLYGVAPDLSKKIAQFEDNAENQDKLVKIYKTYLSPNGFLDKALELHANKLECFNRLMTKPQNKHVVETELKKIDLETELKDILFHDQKWCEGDEAQLIRKQELMQAFLDSLAQCEHPSGIKARMNCYSDLKDKIDNNENIGDLAEKFKDPAVLTTEKTYAVSAFTAQYKGFENLIEDLDDPNSREDLDNHNSKLSAMREVLKCVQAIANYEDDDALESMDSKELDKLTHILSLCQSSHHKSLDVNDPEEFAPLKQELNSLSHEAMRSSSPLWRALAEAVKFFVSIISPTKQVDIVQDKKLSDAIIKYNSALYKSALQERTFDVGYDPDEEDRLNDSP